MAAMTAPALLQPESLPILNLPPHGSSVLSNNKLPPTCVCPMSTLKSSFLICRLGNLLFSYAS
jgi:hypothetical protein